MRTIRRNIIVCCTAAAVIGVLGGPAAAQTGADPVNAGALERQALTGRVEAARQAGVPPEDLEIIVTRGLGRGAGAQLLGGLIDIAANTARQGLPSRPVVDRIEQGLSKGVPLERIDAAARRLADGLAGARPVVDGLLASGMPPGTGARDAALESVARAGEQGLPPGRVEAIGKAVRAQGRSLDLFERAVRTLSFLAGSGVPEDAAVRIVHDCIDHDLTERGLARLERKVGDMVRRGQSTDEIVRAAEREVREDRGADHDGGRMDRGAGGGRDAGGRPGRGR